jgi:ribosomal protein L37AE/L43A
MEVTMMATMTASTRRSDYGMICTHCGDLLIGPDWSKYEDEHHVLNLWSCTKCGIEFETEAFVRDGVEPSDGAAIKVLFPSLLVA